MTPRSRVAVITASAHRGGKRLAEGLADDGWDIALWGMASQQARAVAITSRGQRASVARGNIADPRSVHFMMLTLRESFAEVDAVIHLAPDHLLIAPDGSDPATEHLVALGALSVIYVAEPDLDLTAAQSWCAARQVEATVLDANDKLHNLVPEIRRRLSG